VKYGILYTDKNGDSHFKDGELGFDWVNFAPPAPPVGLTSYMPAKQIVFFKLPSGWFGDWHPAPEQQFFCCLSGEFEFTASDGEHVFTGLATFSFSRIPGVKVTKAELPAKKIL
jgi:hypothetical protein